MIIIKNKWREPFKLTKTTFTNRAYSLSKEQVRNMFENKPYEVSYKYNPTGTHNLAYVSYHPSGAISIGCQRFGRDQVRKLKRWALGKS